MGSLDAVCKTSQGNTSTQERVIRDLFAFLNSQFISYAVMGRTDTLPESSPGDIDIIVAPEWFDKLPALLNQFSKESDTPLVQMLQHEQTSVYFALMWLDENNQCCYIHPDMGSDFFRFGRRLLPATMLLEDRIRATDDQGNDRGFYHAAPANEFIYYLVKKIDKQHLTPEHQEHLMHTFAQAPEKCTKHLTLFWNDTQCQTLSTALTTNNWDAVQEQLPALQKAMLKRAPQSFAHRVKEYGRRFKRLWTPTGMWVAFLGCDGSGKSSVIQQVGESLLPAFRRVHTYHLRPNIGGKKNTHTVDVSNPHQQKPRGWVGSVAKLIYLFLDYSLGYWLLVRNRLVRSTFVMFDRYAMDLLVDQTRYRQGGPLIFIKWLNALIPQPDLVFLLDAPAEVLYARKQEVPLETLTSHASRYRRLVQDMDNGMVIDSNQPLADVVAQVNRIVLVTMAQRMRSRIEH